MDLTVNRKTQAIVLKRWVSWSQIFYKWWGEPSSPHVIGQFRSVVVVEQSGFHNPDPTFPISENETAL